MAKVIVEFDTVEKTMVATIDGNIVNDCCDASFHKCEEDEFCCSIGIRKEDKENKIMFSERMFASKSIEANKLSSSKASQFDGFVIENTNLKSHIEKYFGE